MRLIWIEYYQIPLLFIFIVKMENINTLGTVINRKWGECKLPFVRNVISISKNSWRLIYEEKA